MNAYSIIRSVTGAGDIPLFDSPGPMTITGDPCAYEAIGQFERAIKGIVGLPNAVGVSSGTAAIHVALVALGVGFGDRVAIPTLTFAATAAAVRYCGAVPVFIDADPYTLGLRYDDTERVLSHHDVRAVIGVDLLGHPGGSMDIAHLCKSYGVPLIWDGAESLGSREKGGMVHSGAYADILTVSFNHNKILTTGGGGMVLTSDREIAEKVRHLATTARLPGYAYVHDEVGFNYRMHNLAALVGLAELARIPFHVRVLKKRAVAEQYRTAFAGYQGHFISEPCECRSNYWLNAVALDAEDRDAVIEFCHNHGLKVRPLFTPLHTQSPYLRFAEPHGYPVAMEAWGRTVCLPSGLDLA